MDLLKEIKVRLARKQDTNKGDFGRIFILAGSRGMTGAAHLSALAALRSGAGLVTVGLPENIISSISKKVLEAIAKPLLSTKAGTVSFKAYSEISNFLKTQDVLAIGPGLSQNSETQKLIRKIILNSPVPMVIDADALNAFQGKVDELKKIKSKAVITPHPGEFIRLFGGAIPKGDRERTKRVKEISEKFGLMVVLKGHRTVVSCSGQLPYINRTGNAGMATAGAGDVLTGIIAALLGQTGDVFFSACAGTYIHGLAGDFAAKEKGPISLIASDMVYFLPQAFQRVMKTDKK